MYGVPATCGEMDDNISHGGSDNIDWNTEDELEIANSNISSSSSVSMNATGAVIPAIPELGESSSSSNYPSNLVLRFTKMGFPEAMVAKVIGELGENNVDAILDTLLTYSALDGLPQQEDNLPQQTHESIDPCPKTESNFEIDDFPDFDNSSGDEEDTDEDDPIVCLIDMGYSPEEASAAISRCGKNTPLSELIDFLTAAHLSKEADAEMDILYYKQRFGSCSSEKPKDKKRKFSEQMWKKDKQLMNHDRKPGKTRTDRDGALHLPNPMVGFGVPCEPYHQICRSFTHAATGPPYFYYENVAFTPKGVWNRIQSFLYEIKPEFVDSKFFCAAARKRGYIHNLPLENRFPLKPLPPRTIFEALPGTKRWWPSWDKREQLNCILTCVGSAQLSDRIKSALDNCRGEPPLHVQKYVIGQCKKWNMVWTGKNKVAPLEPDEIELIMGYPTYHTRGASRVERYKGLGNAFQVDTVAYHLSVLKDMFPHGINVLSLFSGIGGAEVALHRLGIRLKNVVSVEKSMVCQGILQSWWEQTNQTGNLIHKTNVEDVTHDDLDRWISTFGGFDLVIGGSPCNNLAGGNRRTRDGLEGEHSSLFYDYFRILDRVKTIMGRY